MMAELTLGWDDCYDCFFVVVDSGGVVGAMDGFLYALPAWSVQRASLPKHSRESARRPGVQAPRRALVKQKSKTAKVPLASLLRAFCFTQ
jgi:hypothetical protein